MRIEIDLNKSLNENASLYFEKAKKSKKKLEGLKKALRNTSKKLTELKSQKEERKTILFKKRKKKWFEKFHWFITSDGLLAIAGRDTTSNEELIKKYMEKEDLYFHAEIYGSPHCILKTRNNSASLTSMKETAEFVASFSKAWKSGLSYVDVYSVLPEQVSKKTPSGESMKTGSFMVYGKRRWFKKTQLNFGIGIKEEQGTFIVISGSFSAIKKHSLVCFKVIQGKESKGATAKKLKELFEKKIQGAIDLDEIISMLPSGNSEVVI
jgi:predicted ribosome quality control (RQC) complex YloA/Tae2 family protein